MDDIEYTAFGWRARDQHPGPFQIPDALTLGRRLTAFRSVCGLSIADVADAAGLRRSQIEEFEEFGAVSAETFLLLLEVLCGDVVVSEAFCRPAFHDRADLFARWCADRSKAS